MSSGRRTPPFSILRVAAPAFTEVDAIEAVELSLELSIVTVAGVSISATVGDASMSRAVPPNGELSIFDSSCVMAFWADSMKHSTRWGCAIASVIAALRPAGSVIV